MGKGDTPDVPVPDPRVRNIDEDMSADLIQEATRRRSGRSDSFLTKQFRKKAGGSLISQGPAPIKSTNKLG